MAFIPMPNIFTMKHFPFTILLVIIAVGVFAQVPPKPTDRAVVYDYANMLTPEDKVSIELMGMKLATKHASRLVFVSVETKGDMKGVEFIRAIYSSWELPNGMKGHCGLIVVCKKQIMASAGGGFLVKCDSALTMKIKDSFQELLDKTTLPPFENTEDQNQQKGSAALKDSYMFFANAIINLAKEEENDKPSQSNDVTTTTEAEAVHPSNEQPSPTAETAMEPSAPTAEKTLETPKTKWLICIIFFAGIVGITVLLKKGSRSKTASIKKQYSSKDYDSNDYRDDN